VSTTPRTVGDQAVLPGPQKEHRHRLAPSAQQLCKLARRGLAFAFERREDLESDVVHVVDFVARLVYVYVNPPCTVLVHMGVPICKALRIYRGPRR
jgi:hypothetical protein